MFNVQRVQKPIHITHPLVRNAYLKKAASLSDQKEEDVLVLEAYGDDSELELGNFDSYLYDLVADLEDLKDQAEKQVGSIDRVDICTH